MERRLTLLACQWRWQTQGPQLGCRFHGHVPILLAPYRDHEHDLLLHLPHGHKLSNGQSHLLSLPLTPC